MAAHSKGILYYSPRQLPDDIDGIAAIPNDGDIDGANEKSLRLYERKRLERLIHAIVRQEQDKFHELLPEVDFNYQEGKSKWTPLVWAVQKDRMYYVKEMFKYCKENKKEINFNAHFDHRTNRTLLHFATEKGNIELLTLLLHYNDRFILKNRKFKLDLNALDREKCTAVYRAAKKGAPTSISILLKYGADPNIMDKLGNTPLLMACHRGHYEAVRELLKCKQIQINLENERGRNAVMCAIAENREKIVSLLLKFDDNINLNNIDSQNYEWNCLMWAVYRKHEGMIELLMKNDKYREYYKIGKKNDDAYKRYKIDYFYTNYDDESVIDMAFARKLSPKLIWKMRTKMQNIIVPIVMNSELAKSVGLPAHLLSMLLVYAY